MHRNAPEGAQKVAKCWIQVNDPKPFRNQQPEEWASEDLPAAFSTQKDRSSGISAFSSQWERGQALHNTSQAPQRKSHSGKPGQCLTLCPRRHSAASAVEARTELHGPWLCGGKRSSQEDTQSRLAPRSVAEASRQHSEGNCCHWNHKRLSRFQLVIWKPSSWWETVTFPMHSF